MSTDIFTDPHGPAAELLAELPLVDHHVHGVFAENPTAEQFATMITESDRTPSSVRAAMDTQVGFAVRRWCAPVLGLPAHVDADAYFEHRIALGADEVNRRLLRAAGTGHALIETGYRGDEIHGPQGMAQLSGAATSTVIRMEAVAERMVETARPDAAGFAQAFAEHLAEAARDAVGLKSIVAYRHGLDFDPAPPTADEVADAAGRWFREVENTGQVRISDPVLLRALIWTGVELRKPIQFHIGYGDPDLDLHRCDPLLMTGLIRRLEALEVPVMLLHTYPFQRHAGYLAQMFRNVFMDVGLAINYTGARSAAIIAESLELAPFDKILFSSDAWGLPELTHLGHVLFRRGLAEVIDDWVARGDWSADDARRVVRRIGVENAVGVYGLPAQSL